MDYKTDAIRIELDQSNLPRVEGAGIDAIKVYGNPWTSIVTALKFYFTNLVWY